LIGKQDVAATLLPGKPSGLVSDHEEFQRLPHRLELSSGGSVQQQFSVVRDYRQGRPYTGVLLFFILLRLYKDAGGNYKLIIQLSFSV
jgi:hypothetical protein